VTFNEYKVFSGKLTPQRASKLQNCVVSFMQKVAYEYKLGPSRQPNAVSKK